MKGPDRNRGNCGDQFGSVPSGDLAEGGDEVASFVETGFRIGKVVLAVLACWWVFRKIANSWVHMTNGSSMERRLLSFDGTSERS